jgi:poly(3-hydroxybutyrate) depolymerase
MRTQLGRPISATVIAVVAMATSTCVVHSTPTLSPYKVDIQQTSVSGVSSGGAMAVQMHVAHASIMRGVGITAGVAYDCANSSLPSQSQRSSRGAQLCVPGLVSAGFSITRTTVADAAGGIDDPAVFLPGQKVWLFSGYNDGSVRRPAMDALAAYYENYVDPGNVFYKTDNKAPHALITDDYGGACLGVDDDSINDCDYDSAGRLLQHIYGSLNQRSTNGLSGSILEFDQGEFVTGTPSAVGLAETGYVYVPLACETDPCRAHVVFHGCSQFAERVGDAVYRHAGYNEWADTNNLIVLYPQTVATSPVGPVLGPVNPKGCWDWWGYSLPLAHRSDYARKSGYQITAVKGMLDRLAEQFQPGDGPADDFGTPQAFSVPDRTPTSANLIWAPNNAASGFNVYRSLANAGPYAQVNAQPVTGASFADRELEPEALYYYQVRAIEQGTGRRALPPAPCR